MIYLRDSYGDIEALIPKSLRNQFQFFIILFNFKSMLYSSNYLDRR